MKRVAIFGSGRSGIAAAKAAIKCGLEVIVVDEGYGGDQRESIAETMRQIGVDFIPNWTGEFTDLGVDAVITSPGVPKSNRKLQAAESARLSVQSEIEFAHNISSAPIIAITGTNGKSTTTVMTFHCLESAGIDAVLCGNIYGSGYDEIPLVEAAATSKSSQVLVAEISSFQLEWINRFRPRVATITNITPDHLNRYNSFEDYAQTKRRIFGNMGEGDVAVWNSGDTAVQPPQAPGLLVKTFGAQGDAAYATESTLSFGECRVPISDLHFSEKHNILNALCAGLMAISFCDVTGNGESEMAPMGLKQFCGIRHRMETVGIRGGVKLINNSMCTNPGALIASSKGINAPQRLLIGGANKELDFAPVAEYLNVSGHKPYLFGRDAQAINATLGGSYPVFDTLDEAFAAAIGDAQPGEVLMLAPGVASMDQFEDFRARGEAFRELALSWLNR